MSGKVERVLSMTKINTKEKTRIKFLTDGMLLREAQRDPSLKEQLVFYQVTFFLMNKKKTQAKRYGCIILDEVRDYDQFCSVPDLYCALPEVPYLV